MREPSVPGWFEARPVATQIFVPLVVNIAAGVMILRVVSSDARLVMLVVLALLLSVLLIAGFVTIDRLLGIVRIQAAPSESVSPSSTLVHESLSSMSRYGFIRNADQVSVIRRRLETAEYVRGEHLLGVLANKIGECKSSLWAINDHPFTPFSALVMQKTSPSTEVRCINSKPDRLYTQDSIERRLRLAQSPTSRYYLMPAEDVHLSLVIFDRSTAILYTTPAGHSVCNYSEALFASDPYLLTTLCMLFERIEKLAIGWHREMGMDASEILKQHLVTVGGGS